MQRFVLCFSIGIFTLLSWYACSPVVSQEFNQEIVVLEAGNEQVVVSPDVVKEVGSKEKLPEPVVEARVEPVLEASGLIEPVAVNDVLPEKPVMPEEPTVMKEAPPEKPIVRDEPPASVIWKPKPGTTWHWQLSGKLDMNKKVAMYDIDLFDHSTSTFKSLQAKGIIVICYFSAGSYEAWRSDAKQFPSAAKGKKMDGWNELWLDIRHQGVLTVMKKRLDLAKQKGCNGVEPDNVDGYQNSTGFPLKSSDQLKYNKFLAAEAHKRGLSIGLKNDVDQVKALEPYFDWAINEECYKYKECNTLQPFIQAGKAVFHVEYRPLTRSKVCATTKPLRFSTLIKKLDLDAWEETCSP